MNDAASSSSSPTFRRPRFIALEGPIRVGKSTLARILAERLHARRIYDCEDNPFLSSFYDDVAGSAFRAQMYFLFERRRRMKEAAVDAVSGTVVSDFLFEKDRIFANINLDNEELRLYDHYYEMLSRDLPIPDLVVYLQASPAVLRQRMEKKRDPSEADVADEYLGEVVKAYEHFFFRYTASDLLVVNTSDIDFVERDGDLQQLLRRLQEPVKGTQYYLPLGG